MAAIGWILNNQKKMFIGERDITFAISLKIGVT